jgi:signal transduction histidine kinase
MHHTHDLAHEFSSLDVRGDDLCAMLKGLAANVKKMFDLTCAVTTRGTLPELPKHTVIQLYKIAQEAVSNAIKHGKASQVSVGLVFQDEELTLTVKNNGASFEMTEKAKNRMGLRIMNYRANSIGGTLDIKPLTKGGTLVTCVVPTKKASKSHRRGESSRHNNSPEDPAGVIDSPMSELNGSHRKHSRTVGACA